MGCNASGPMRGEYRNRIQPSEIERAAKAAEKREPKGQPACAPEEKPTSPPAMSCWGAVGRAGWPGRQLFRPDASPKASGTEATRCGPPPLASGESASLLGVDANVRDNIVGRLGARDRRNLAQSCRDLRVEASQWPRGCLRRLQLSQRQDWPAEAPPPSPRDALAQLHRYFSREVLMAMYALALVLPRGYMTSHREAYEDFCLCLGQEDLPQSIDLYRLRLGVLEYHDSGDQTFDWLEA